MEDDVRVLSEPTVEAVVLKMGRVEMFTHKLINTILSNDALEVVHGEEVRVVPGRSNESHREASVQHFIVSLVEEGRSKEGLITVGDLTDSRSRDVTEVRADL